MPLYEYRCESCGAKEEKLQSISAVLEHECPACGAQLGMKRQISRASFALSGRGWYASGYGDIPKTEDAKTESKTEASEAPSEAKAPTGCAAGCACHSPRIEKKVEELGKA
jgi:putative FmdB family regulatory protein